MCPAAVETSGLPDVEVLERRPTLLTLIFLVAIRARCTLVSISDIVATLSSQSSVACIVLMVMDRVLGSTNARHKEYDNIINADEKVF